MDIALPKLNGLEAARQILKESNKTHILILSAHADDGYIEKAMSIGVSGYLIKQCSPKLLIQAIREIEQGKHFFSPLVSDRIGLLRRRQLDAKGTSKQRKPKLSTREAEVLQQVAEGNANKQIASELGISIKTVEKHRQNLMKKLSIHDTAGLTRYAIAEGVIESSSQTTVL
jgi:DNA-binding NarL/FixJ family response regulator